LLYIQESIEKDRAIGKLYVISPTPEYTLSSDRKYFKLSIHFTLREDMIAD